MTRALLLSIALWQVAGAAAQSPPPAKAQQCTVCHGALGMSTAPDAPNLGGQPRQYLVAQMKQFRSGKRPSEVMGVISRALSDEDIDALADWYASIRISAAPVK